MGSFSLWTPSQMGSFRRFLLAGVLVHLVALGHVIAQRVAVQPPLGIALHEPSQLQQVLAIAAQLAGQPRRSGPLGEAAEDQDDLGRAATRPARAWR